MEIITSTTLLMSEGEVMQLLNIDNHDLTEKEYEEVIYRKTAILISSACEIGAILGNANNSQREQLKNYGLYIGMAFQIIDDLIDYLSAESGKDLGKDFAEGKVTLPIIYTLQVATPEEKEKIKSLLKKTNPSTEDFYTIFKIIQHYKGFEKTKKKAKYYINLAKNSLNSLPDNKYKNALLFPSEYLLERKK